MYLCEKRDPIGMFARNVGVLILSCSPNYTFELQFVRFDLVSFRMLSFECFVGRRIELLSVEMQIGLTTE